MNEEGEILAEAIKAGFTVPSRDFVSVLRRASCNGPVEKEMRSAENNA